MLADFPVAYNTILTSVDEFDGIFNRDNMVFSDLIGLINDGGKGG